MAPLLDRSICVPDRPPLRSFNDGLRLLAVVSRRVVTRATLATVMVSLLAACGGGGGNGIVHRPPVTPPPVTPPPVTPPPVTPPPVTLPPVTLPPPRVVTEQDPRIATSFGTTKLDHYPLDVQLRGNSGFYHIVRAESEIASRDEVLALLKENIPKVTTDGKDRLLGGHVFPTPPVVRFVEGTTPEARAHGMRILDIFNAWLPYEKHVTVGDDLDTPTSKIWNLVLYEAHENYGEIYVSISPDDPDSYNAGRGGPHGIFVGKRVSPDNWGLTSKEEAVYSDQFTQKTVLHELFHAMGFTGERTCLALGDACTDSHRHVPVSKFPESTLSYRSFWQEVHGLSQIDGEALQTIYAVLHDSLPTYVDVLRGLPNPDPNYIAFTQKHTPGALIAYNDDTAPLSLGPWDDAVVRYAGSLNRDWPDSSLNPLGRVLNRRPYVQPSFGVDWRNGMARPWANGEIAYGTFANSGLSGSATWNGELVGFTPDKEAVHGYTAIKVDLAALNGHAVFDALEHWEAGAPPGSTGTGTKWGDGDLHYSIKLNGNYLRSTAGDEGYVSGRFVGGRHEGVVGILEHPDLAAGWGALR